MMKKKETGGRAFDVVTFGETMLRLSAPGFSRLEEAVTLDVRIGGAESNTAVALARLGLKASWWSRLPANPLGRRIENEIRRWGVDTSGVIWDTTANARAGLYFLDFGLSPRSIDVYYDRAASAAATLRPEEIDRERLASARLLHLTGITPALSVSCAEAISRAVTLAKEVGTAISFDVNYRAKLWTPETAKRQIESFLSSVDVLFCPLTDAQTIFGIESSDGPTVARELRVRYGVGLAVVTCGGDGAVACDDRGDWAASSLPLGQVVDRVGAGDAFNAGVLMGYLEDDVKTGLEYGAAMAALKHTMPGDLLLSTRQEIEAARAGGVSGITR